MEEYTEEQLQRIKLQILNREISICETCNTLFDYVPQKKFCETCAKIKQRLRRNNYRKDNYWKTDEYRLRKSAYDKRLRIRKKILRILDE